MFYRNWVFKWWMGPIVGAAAGMVCWIRLDDAQLPDDVRLYTMLGVVAGSTLAGAIVSGLDLLRSRSAAQADVTGAPPLPLLGYFFALCGILLCWMPVFGIALNIAALRSSRQRRGLLRTLNWIALILGVVLTIAMIVAIILGN